MRLGQAIRVYECAFECIEVDSLYPIMLHFLDISQVDSISHQIFFISDDSQTGALSYRWNATQMDR